MKPISIKFKNWGPYTKEVFIPFDGLDLFLICGDTGSGKTSILDAICFALYGTSTGGLRDKIEMLRCSFADPKEDTIVEFVFESNGKTYKFKRGLRVNRNGNLDDLHNCFVYDGVDFKPILSNPKMKNVTAKAEEIIGLTAEQFRQVVVLPQGQFEKFLTSNSDDKEKILTTLFNANKWDQVVENVRQQIKEQRDNCNNLSTSLSQILLKYKVKTFSELVDKKERDSASFNFIKTQEKDLEKSLKKVRKEIDSQTSIENKFKDLDKLQNKKKDLDNELKNIEKMEEMLKLSDNMTSIQSSFEHFQSVKKDFNQLHNQFLNDSKIVASLKEEVQKLIQKEEILLNKEKEQEEKKERIIELKGKTQYYNVKDSKEKELKEQEKLVNELSKKLEIFKQKEQSTLASFEIISKELKEKQEEHRVNTELYLNSISGILAKDLLDNSPCPVCGSLHHPNLAKAIENVSRETIDKLNQECIELTKKTDLIEKDKENARIEREKIEKDFREGNSRYEQLKSDFDKVLENIEKEIQTAKDLEKVISTLEKEVKTFEEELKSIQATKIQKLESSKVKEELLEKLSRELNEKKKDMITSEEECHKVYLKNRGKSVTLDVMEDELKKGILKPEEYKKKESTVTIYREDVRKNLEELKEQEKKLKNKERVNLDAMKAEANTLDSELTKVRNKSAENKAILDLLEKDVKEYEKKEKAYQDAKLLYDENEDFYKKLSGATGVSLKRYVLGVMMTSITVEANQLLKKVHNGRYQLYRSDESTGLAKKKGLELGVIDQFTNEKRSVATLSGGEKFLVALSLAIGLSTVVQAQGKGVQLGAMFIDEGFGSLDQNSINDALDVLQSIQKANGIVGIISHVELLQTVIPKKIEITKKTLGSELKIVT